MSYAELQVTTNFSFLRGASHAHELAGQAAELGHRAIAVTDRNTLAGAVRLHQAAKQAGLRPVIGARLDFTDAPSVLVYPTDRAAYGRLSRMLTTGKRRTTKGECSLQLADLLENAEGLLAVALQPDGRLTRAAGEQQLQHLGVLRATFGDRLYLGVQNLLRGDDARRLAWAIDAVGRLDIPLVATNDVHAHARGRRALQDVMTCIRERTTLRAVGRRLHANGERYLKDEAAMRELFAACPEAVDRTVEIVERCRFDLDTLRYEYPIDTIPAGRTAQQHLVQLTWEGAARMYPDGVPDKVRGILEHELALVDQLAYAPYFLTVHDIVSYARGEGILCQGRGSAANSAVCYVLGITAVDPARSDMLFERFISPERKEPPDIDVDFENERREEVYQYIYRRYGRERAGLAATVITYRSKSAIRDVGKALGLSSDTIDRLARSAPGWDQDLTAARLRDAGIDPRDRTARRVLALAGQLYGFPRHLSQHVGGFVITRGRLDESVPIENAAMEDRTCIEWDKDDLDALGMLKIDILALGMLTCVRKAFEFLEARTGHPFRWHDVPPEDPAVYDMLCQADSVGVFQVESRAQMSMLPRLKPRCFYDLVIEVAIVRPGPIQGDMVHPYLRRRQNKEPVAYPKEELRRVLGKTLGVPLFQEQAMAIAITAAGFSPGEADQLRRSMSAYRRTGRVAEYRDRMVSGMVARGYDQAFAEHCFSQIEGFGEYGFPESHAASFALIVYVSAWLKKHHPAIFCAAILNSQPMGFYAPAQLVRDAREHGVEVRPVDINHSDWDCALETGPRGLAVRLGMRQVKGMREVDAARIAAARGDGYNEPREVWRRAEVTVATLERLAEADAWRSMGLDRRSALWAIRGLGDVPLPLFEAADRTRRPGDNRPSVEFAGEPQVLLPAMTLGEEVVHDYQSLRLSLKAHPMSLLRRHVAGDGILSTAEMRAAKDGSWVATAGLVLIRQRPGTSSGVIFATLEDETGVANIIVWPQVYERYRRAVVGGRLLEVRGRLQKEGLVIHLIARHVIDRSPLLRELGRIDGPDQAEPLLTEREAVDAMPGSRDFR